MRAQAGVTWGEFDAATQEHGLATTGGRVTDDGHRRAHARRAAAAGSSGCSASRRTTCSRPRSSPPTDASCARARTRTPISSGGFAAAAGTSASSPSSSTASTRSARWSRAAWCSGRWSRPARSFASTATGSRPRPTRSAAARRSSSLRPSRSSRQSCRESPCWPSIPMLVRRPSSCFGPIREFGSPFADLVGPMPYVDGAEAHRPRQPSGEPQLLEGRGGRGAHRRAHRSRRRAREQDIGSPVQRPASSSRSAALSIGGFRHAAAINARAPGSGSCMRSASGDRGGVRVRDGLGPAVGRARRAVHASPAHRSPSAPTRATSACGRRSARRSTRASSR